MTMDYTWLFVKMLFALGVVSALAIIILKYIVPQWVMPKKLTEGQFFKLVARYYLGPKKFLCLVRAGKRNFVIGVSDNGMNLISEVEDEETIEQK